MGHKVTIGGDRLGVGHQQEIYLDGYHSSNHDLGFVFRSSMTFGTLVPFCKIPMMNGDNFDIDVSALIKTRPTVGPLYGTATAKIDFFFCPNRLYIGALHNNRTGIGQNMDKVILPTIKFEVPPTKMYQNYLETFDMNALQVAPDSLVAYLGIRGFGNNTSQQSVEREFNGIPFLAIADIFKNYYANKQEKNAYVITHQGNGTQQKSESEPTFATQTNAELPNGYLNLTLTNLSNTGFGTYAIFNDFDIKSVTITYKKIGENIPKKITINIGNSTEIDIGSQYNKLYIETNADAQGTDGKKQVEVFYGIGSGNAGALEFELYNVLQANGTYTPTGKGELEIQSFPLENIDEAREIILSKSKIGQAVQIAPNGDINFLPYSANTDMLIINGEEKNASALDMNGLLLRTYLSDLNQNWIRTEWIEEINAASAIQIGDSGTFSMDALVVKKRVWNYLNRVAVSGGTYQDWQEATWGRDAQRFAESPIYVGGASFDISFEEVTATAATADEALGTLAGKGRMNNYKGGKINVKAQEIGYLIGIVSIIPRVDYYQGNDWDMTDLKTMDDYHKPEFDRIGFQDLIEERLAAWSTKIDAAGQVTQTSIGKQPAWSHYMSNVNRVYGDFCREANADYMVITRKYEPTQYGEIADATTYVFPQHYNYLFAASKIDWQPFWMQIGCNIFARRIMSAASMPTL